jgi:ribosomal protein L37AE/L43A
LAEQLNPYTGEPLSVSPLTWSHATFVSSIQRIVQKFKKMHVCPECGLPLVERKEDWITQLYSKTCNSIYGTCKVK